MAVPIWIPIALAIGSVAANRQAQARVDDRQARDYQRYMDRQKDIEKKADDAAARTQAQYEDQATQVKDRGQEWAEALKEGQGDVYGMVAPSRTAGTVAPTTDRVVEGQTRSAQGTRRFTNQLADALGMTRGFDQSFLDSSLVARDNLLDIRQQNINSRNNQGLLTNDLQASSDDGAPLGTLGDLMSLAAMVTAPMAMSAAPAGTEAASVIGPDSLSMSPKFLQPEWAKAAMSQRPIPVPGLV